MNLGISSFGLVVRRLLKTPGFAITALATLAICLGANLAIFAVVDAILVRSLPYPDSGRLVTLYYVYPRLANAGNGSSLTNYYERRGQIRAFDSLSSINTTTSVIGESGSTAIENVGRVTPEFFSTLGVKPLMGRSFKEEELTYNTDNEAILSYERWQAGYQGDPSVLGMKIRIDGIPRTIVGVLPPGFQFLSFNAPVYMPYSSEASERSVNARHSIGPTMVARLAPGATLAEAQAQVNAHDAAHAAEFPDAKIVAAAGARTVVAPLHADYVASVRPTLLLLQSAALCLLLIGGVNLVNLLLTRASGRARELAIRKALGATNRHVMREVASETLALTLAGGILGLVVAFEGIRALNALGADQLPLGSRIVFNARLAAMALVGSVAVGALIGAPIAFFNVRGGIASAIQSESRGYSASRRTRRIRHGFIVAQIALAFVLLSFAGLLGLSLRRAMEVAPGFRSDHVITGRFYLTWSGYHDIGRFDRFFTTLFDRVRAVPGISDVGAVSDVPVVPVGSRGIVGIAGYTPPPGEEVAVHNYLAVAGDYLKAMGIPLVAGRYLDGDDDVRARNVCVVDEAFARHYWPGGGAVGKIIYRDRQINPDSTFTIVGVVGTVKQSGLTDGSPRGTVYYSYKTLFIRNYFLVARTSLEPEALATVLSKVVRETDPEIPLTDIRSMRGRMSDSLSTRRTPALMAAIFAISALLLATIGLYGVMAYGVAQRTSEFGIRMALGARRLDVLSLVLVQGARLSAIGLGLGLAGAFALGRSLSGFLFGVGASDPLVLAAVAMALVGVAIPACLIPSLKATRVDPIVALRSE